MAIIDSNYIYNNAVTLADVNKALSQSFVGNGANLKYATFFAHKSGNPTGNVYAKLYAHSGVYGTSSVPTGSPLATSDPIAANSLPTENYWTSFTFPSPIIMAGQIIVLLSNI
jgi:hypothetical protein